MVQVGGQIIFLEEEISYCYQWKLRREGEGVVSLIIKFANKGIINDFEITSSSFLSLYFLTDLGSLLRANLHMLKYMDQLQPKVKEAPPVVSSMP